MICRHFGECGSCSIYESTYEEQLEKKLQKLSSLLSPFYDGDISVFSSEREAYRARAEYKIYRDEEGLFYAMRHLDKKGYVKLDECPMVSLPIRKRMWRLLDIVKGDEELGKRLFGVEFLSASTDEVLVTMLYHRKLEDEWQKRAKDLEKILDIRVIGRSRKQKIVVSSEYVTEILTVRAKEYSYRHYEQSFTQPNTGVNEKMIEWAMDGAKEFGEGDFCELYAGAGNFTIPLSTLFEKAIATEISKRSIHAALENCAINGVENIAFVRMSSEEFTEALSGKREFNRLKGVDLQSYDLKTLLVDPPRAGLDEATGRLASMFETIIYISCNPQTLARDLEKLTKSHGVKRAALFDQFPYTPHMEAGVVLVKS